MAPTRAGTAARRVGTTSSASAVPRACLWRYRDELHAREALARHRDDGLDEPPGERGGVDRTAHPA
eukprot:4198494-Prymnesium_polylepis.2